MSPFKPVVSLAAFVVIAGFLAWTLWPKGDENAIHKQLDAIEAAVSSNGNTSPLESAIKAANLTKFFTPDCEILPFYKLPLVRGRDSLKGPFAALIGSASEMNLTLSGRSIAITASKDEAVVRLTANGSGMRTGGDGDSFSEPFELLMRKDDDGWLIHRLEPLE